MAMADETKLQTADSSNSASSKAKKKKNRKRPRQPQPGDPDYKTPTQLRNARKRRKKKQDKANALSGGGSGSGKSTNTATTSTTNTAAKQLPYGSTNDPSLKYLSNPKAAPTVRNALKFFREKTNALAGTSHDEYFPVVVGPKLGWRTVARLAVRVRHDNSDNDKKHKLRIGLFVPGSHELLPVPDCPVHHRKINGLVKILENTCNSIGVPALDDDAEGGVANPDSNSNNTFGLRYVAIAIERKTQKQQLVLVWKEANDDNSKTNNTTILDTLIQKLVELSRDRNQKDINLHSVWVHYNNTWKHSNSILDRNGRWETKFVNGKLKNDEEDPLVGAIRETMIPLVTKPNKEKNKTNSKSSHTSQESSSSSTANSDAIHVPLYFPPQVFRQANLDGFAKIILRIREWLHEQQAKEPATAISSSSSTTAGLVEAQVPNHAGAEPVPPKRKRRRGKRDTSNHANSQNQTETLSQQQNSKSSISPTAATAADLPTLGHCLELYGGVGTIGLNLVDCFDSLDSSDENPFNQVCFHKSADQLRIRGALLDPSKRSKITYASQSASEMVSQQYESLQSARVVIVDPPRKGLDAPVLEALCSDYNVANGSGTRGEQQQQHLIYVSCGFDAFRRDYRALVEHSGKWTLDRAEGHILFPGSDAIETLAFFTRTK